MSSFSSPARSENALQFFFRMLFKSVKRAFSAYFRGSGRASRSEYWMFTLANFLFQWIIIGTLTFFIELFFIALTEITGSYSFTDAGTFVSTTISTIASLATFIPGITILVRRLHDSNKSAHYLWLFLAPCVGWIVLLVFTMVDSDKGPNRYGPPSDYWQDRIRP